MAFWKQLALSLVVLLVAGLVWIRYFPGAPEIVAGWGWDWALAAAPPQQTKTSKTGAVQPGGGFGALQASVITAPVEKAVINNRLSAIGTGQAIKSVVVTPFSAGRLTQVLVDSGADVKAGQVIAKLDSDGEQIAVDRAKIAREDAQSKLQRIQALRSSNTVTKVDLADAQLALQNAELALRDAQLALDRRSITAPIDGTVGIIPVSAGNYVTAQTQIATIDDNSRILVDFWVPERYSGLIAVGGAVDATSIARPNEVFSGAVSAVDNRIDPASRTLHVQALIANSDNSLRAGMSFNVTMHFPGDVYPAVDPLAIQWGSDGAFVWAVEDGKAHRTAVRIIQRNTDSVLVDASLGEGVQVVTEGIHAVREGAPISIAGQEPSSPPPTETAGAAGANGS